MVDYIVWHLVIRLQDEKTSVLQSGNLVPKYKKHIVVLGILRVLLLCRKSKDLCCLLVNTH